jgi:tRNA-Thr(GGU) m(6)t(6)A37 methyltransferase TsaA
MTRDKKTVKNVLYRPIGIIHSPFSEIQGMPIQPSGAKGIAGEIEILPEYAGGLKDLIGFSHIILIYHFHLSDGFSLKVKPFLDNQLRGVFSTRAPKRPNPIGISVVRLRTVKGTTLFIEDIDVVDGTPLLDIKPYVPRFEAGGSIRTGWLAKKAGTASRKKSDGRFGL